MPPPSNDDLSPSDFVRKIRELGERRDQEDAQRFTELEREIEKSREERIARRAERARSLSPEKAFSPPPPDTTRNTNNITSKAQPDAPRMAEPSNEEAPRPLSRSGTLSWQQRPKSSGGRRPLSMLAAENAARSPRATPEPANEDAPELSRTQITESLASRDPSWFKQTADRGIGSAAYRRNQEDSTTGSESGAGKFRMPGMSRESTAETEGTASPPPESVRSTSPSRASSIRMSTASSRYSSTTVPSETGSLRMRSPPPSIMDAPKLNPTSSDRKSPLTGRPPSPTKGMGGFVESAMLKRADSVSKRWSTQQPAGLSRQNSTASNRNSYYGGSGSTSPTRLDRAPSVLGTGNSLEPGSRPSSSHSNLTVTQSVDDVGVDRDGFVKPALPLHSRAKSVASLKSTVQDTDEQQAPTSPLRRWSPTKSTWLESALTKTEDKPKAQITAPSQPSWMTEINKAKQHNRNNSVQDSPTKLTNPDPFPRQLSPVNRSHQASPSITNSESPPPVSKAKSPSPEPAAKPISLVKEASETSLTSKSPSSVLSSPSTKSSWEAKKSPPVVPGKFDFRANLKSRQSPTDGNSNNVPEFKNALGKLKRTTTEKFVAPDVLKDNILRGKSGLTMTGGPAKRERVDELKESLLKQKEAMKAAAATGGPKRPTGKPTDSPAIPEALAKRQILHRSQSSTDSAASAKSPPPSTPEAISRMKTFQEKAKPALPQKPTSPPTKSAPIFAGTRTSLPERPGSAAETKLSSDSISSKDASRSQTKKVDENKEGPTQPQPFALPGMAKAGVSGKLASRFNPALAGIVARGPPTAGKNSSSSEPAASTAKESSATEPLEHKTKGRARGPKRRAPATKQYDEPSAKSSPALPASDSSLRSVEPSVLSSKSADDPTASPAPLFSKSKVSAPVTSPKLALSSTNVTLSSVPLVRSKDILSSSPKNSISSEQQIETATSPRKVSTPTKAKPLAPTKSPLLVEKPLAQATDRENFMPERTESASKTQMPTSRTPLQEQDTGSGSKPSDSIRSPPAARALPSPSATLGSMAVHEDRSGTRDSPLWSKQSYPKPDMATPPSSIPKDSPAVSETTTPSVSVKNATALWSRQGDSTPSSPGRPKSPVKLPTRLDEEKAMRDAGLMPPPDVPDQIKKAAGVGLGISASTSGQATANSKIDRSNPKLPLSPPLSPGSANLGTNRALTMPGKNNSPSTQVPKMDGARSRPASTSLKAPPESPIPHTTEANRLFTEFFDDRPVVASETEEIDTVAILESYPITGDKVQTLIKKVQMISGDGKLLSIPSHQEHILFDDSMYVCTHTFKATNGSKLTEVYLWAGSHVPPAAVEDAQLFGRRVAKDNNGKLIVLQQGKETPNFLQAVGGILITFHGSRSRSSSAGLPDTFMLCGRRHMGHITFDEVDFSLNLLCSGFLYLVSSNGRLYLWKGKGCGAEELGCARLIAMDMGTTPDITEISETEESASFFKLFPSIEGLPAKAVPRQADHWRLKTTNDKYRCRLFRVEQQSSKSSTLQVSTFFSNLTRRSSWSSSSLRASPSPTPSEQPKTPTTPSPLVLPTTTKIVEIAPFTQGDVEAEGIFVLDAFFEVYILIGPLAQSQSHAFTTALLFVQDYGILAASLEDRPFVPVSTVVLEGIPRDMKPCFRQWSDEAFGFGKTEALMSGKPRRGGSLRCVGLSAALAATRS